MNKVPKASIVIPTLNCLPLLRNCIDGISRTLDVTFEVIVVNNGSKNETKEYLYNEAELILSKNSNFIRLIPIHLPQNRFISGGINTGMEFATGEFLSIVANDILVPPKMYSWGIKFLQDHPENGVVGPYSTENPQLQNPDVFYSNYDKIPKQDKWAINWHNSVVHILTRECWNKVGGWDEILRNHTMDNSWGLRAFFAGFSPTAWEGIIAYHHNGSYGRSQISNQKFWAKKDSRYYLKKWGVFPDRPYSDIPKCIQERAAKGLYLSNAQLNYRNKIRNIKLQEEGQRLDFWAKIEDGKMEIL